MSPAPVPPDPVDCLLVEDDPRDLELALRALRKARLSDRIQVVRDGAEALEFCFSEGAFAGRPPAAGPRLILLDLKLPRLDGLAVLERLKGDPRTSSIPVVVLTSSQERRDVVRSYQLGANSYVVKPVNFERFTQAVHDLALYWLSLNQHPAG